MTRLQRGRALGGHVQRVEAAVGRAVHADVAVAPVLGGEPCDHLGQVALLLVRVFVGRPSAAAARAADIQTGHRVVEFVAQPGVFGAVGRGQVVLAVRQRLEDARLCTALGKVERDGEALTVRHRDPLIATGPCHGTPNSRAHPIVRKRVDGPAADSGGRRGGQQRVDHGLLGRIDGRFEIEVETGAGDGGR